MIGYVEKIMVYRFEFQLLRARQTIYKRFLKAAISWGIVYFRKKKSLKTFFFHAACLGDKKAPWCVSSYLHIHYS